MPETLVQITLPEMGESVTQGSIVAWRKQPGEFIAEGDPLVEVTTDKVDVEVPATASGVVKKILVAEGDTVAVGAVLAEIDTATKGDSAKAPSTPAAAKPAATAPVAQPPPKGNGAPAAVRGGEIVATPQARRAARQLEVDLRAVRGTGPNGLILREDVDRAGTAGVTKVQPQLAPLPPLPAQAKVTPLKGPLATLASYMEQSLAIPTATSFRTIAVDTLDGRRRDLNAAIKAAGRSEKVSFTHVIAFALIRAAREMPFIASHFRRDGDRPVRVEPGIHLGLAVDAERKDGSRFLVVPVIKNADALDFAAFRNTYESLVTKARENALTADELQGASFTLTNPGGIGTAASVPRLMAGQGAIIATGAIGYPPGFSRANEASLKALGITKIMQITSTYDHRVIQGAQSGEYLRRVDELLQGKDGFYEALFASLGLHEPPTATETIAEPRTTGAASDEMVRAVAAGMALVAAYRTHGHLAAHLDPLGSAAPGDPSLEPANWGLTPSLQSAVPASVLRVKMPGNTLADILPRLRDTYSSTIAYEVEHISNTEQREWLRDAIESGKYQIAFSDEHKLDLLLRLTRVEVFERYLRKIFLGQKTFSLEGLDVMVPMIEELLNIFAADGTQSAVLGMAHRGRLNTIAHIVNRPYEEILTEFEAAHERGEVGAADVTGDVKYHQGAAGIYETSSGKKIRVSLINNPSHLEAVDPVVEGTARALQTDHSEPVANLDPKKAIPILIHGDAAFPGQGVVAEVLNLQSLPGYTTGGTIHIIANN
ncbi:MAG TPA: 2-oxo acid dehydrogenase subunit E2, partial [Candidatus Rubrimentiphilum sp.]|nr:2-oxo acid dehydrogenase subunit E2 [Candidatus Rubrimentiphilum sp.]